MHVLYLNYHYDSSLSSTEDLLHRYHAMTGWCKALRKAGASNVTVVQRFSKSELRSVQGVDYHFIADGLRPNLVPWETPAEVHKKVVSLDPDIVHANGKTFPLRALRLHLKRDVPILWQHHGGSIPPWYSRWMYAAGFRSVDGTLFTASEQADAWKQKNILNHRMPVYEIPESSTAFEPDSSSKQQSTLNLLGNPILLWVGRLNKNKDPITVLHGIKLIEAECNAHLYIIYQAGNLFSKVVETIAALNLTDRVHLLGVIPHNRLSGYYCAADYYVIGSHSEGSGFSFLESLACGLPAIVPDIPSFRKLSGHGQVAYLWKAGNPASFAQAVRNALQRPLPREQVRSYFQAHLSYDVLGKKALQIYEAARKARLSRLREVSA